MPRKRWLLIASVLAVVGGGVGLIAVRNDRLAFTIDHTQPFWLEFGRGSGWHGLDTVKLDWRDSERPRYSRPDRVWPWSVSNPDLEISAQR